MKRREGGEENGDAIEDDVEANCDMIRRNG
jgi:hypothetical protein